MNDGDVELLVVAIATGALEAIKATRSPIMIVVVKPVRVFIVFVIGGVI